MFEFEDGTFEFSEHFRDSCHEQGGCRIDYLLVSKSDMCNRKMFDHEMKIVFRELQYLYFGMSGEL